MKSNIHPLAGFSLIVLASAASMFSGLAQAHHSAAPFDFAKTITIEGTVKSFEVMNPHTHALVTLADAQGTRDIDFEGHSASNFYPRGIRQRRSATGRPYSAAHCAAPRWQRRRIHRLVQDTKGPRSRIPVASSDRCPEGIRQ